MNTEQIKEFFDAIRTDDVFGLTSMMGESPELLNTPDVNGVSPLMYALYMNKKDVVNLLLQSGAKLDTAASAALGKAEKLQKLITEDPKRATALGADGWTPLHLACFFGHKEAVRILLDAGAPVLVRSTNPMNNHPIHAAAAGRSRDIVAMLIEKGADVSATQHGGWTPLHAAAQNGDVEMAKLLVLNGADVKARADNNQSALDLALGKGSQEMADLLREHGAE
jgi:ankyrin repeat protein